MIVFVFLIQKETFVCIYELVLCAHLSLLSKGVPSEQGGAKVRVGLTPEQHCVKPYRRDVMQYTLIFIHTCTH